MCGCSHSTNIHFLLSTLTADPSHHQYILLIGGCNLNILHVDVEGHNQDLQVDSVGGRLGSAVLHAGRMMVRIRIKCYSGL